MHGPVAVALALVLTGTAAAADPPEVFTVDPSASRVQVLLRRAGLLKFLGHDHRIAAPIAEGRVEVRGGDPAHTSVRLRFEARRLAVVPGSEPVEDVPKVEERMRGAQVLDVERHAEVVFESSAVAVEASGPSGYRLTLRGSLRLKGRSLPVVIPLEVERAGSEIHARGELEWGLRDLGIEPPSVAGVVNVSNRFRIAFEITARQEPAPSVDAAAP